jgi:porin
MVRRTAWTVTAMLAATGRAWAATTMPSTDPTTAPAASAFDGSTHLLGDPFGYRSTLADRGITIEPSIVLDESKVLRGGLNTRDDAPRGAFLLAVTADTEKLFGLHGGQVYALMQDRFGVDASARLVGDAQDFAANTNVGASVELAQLYYRQTMGPGDGLVVKAGKIDANADFDVMENGQEFINNSWGGNPTIGPLPSYPNTSTGLDLFALPGPNFYGGVGVFDGSFARGVDVGAYGPSHFLDRGDNLFLIGEVGSRFNTPLDRVIPALAGAKLAGHVGVGGWYSTDPYHTLGGGTTHGTGGTYVVLDQVLWTPSAGPAIATGASGEAGAGGPPPIEDPRSVAVDFSYAAAESDVNLIDRSIIGGITWVGPLPSRMNDAAGVGVLVADLSPRARRRAGAETALEAFYRIRFTPSVSLKPDLQYIFHPDGGGAIGTPLVKDALVFDVRVEVAF